LDRRSQVAPRAHADAEIVGNRAGLLRLREQIDHALETEDGLASMHWNGYREIDGRVYGLMVFRATRPEQMGEAREPDPPDYSMLT
jgi:hypothetical protein